MNRTKNAYNRWSETYDDEKNPQTALEEESVVDLLDPGKSDKILDAGCGTGRYCGIFQSVGAEVVGVDFSIGMLNVAKKKYPNVDFILADLTQELPFKDSSFTKVNCAQTMKHLSDIGFTLSEFSRLITTNGTITFSVTHPEMYWDNYKKSTSSSCILTEEADIHHYRFCDYFEAIKFAGLQLFKFIQVPVNKTIRDFLTPESYEIVKGRYQIAIFQLMKI